MNAFLSGKISGLPREEAEAKFNGAEEEIKQAYRNRTVTVFNPVKEVPVQASYEQAMLVCLRNLTAHHHYSRMKPRIDVLVFIDDEEFEGRELEIEVARACAIPMATLEEMVGR